ncbi:pyruvate carboxyltransferase [Clostridium sp. 2-1]|uniref:pyruvate carboxyltransferase n=1 Tax=Clostridium TaxID=1485 RepID=UPI000CDADE6D|nr:MULTISPECIES: pyruvate carboxyltransferase [Clostridium]MBN7573063.1 pyruvate carboxyltransferase [Clostridium beijerinckii]MBN7578402.1 pyruvate carboxyltransferase [Clostridium beijerinckii]MBN7582837.1 pyruvate carboxyltransferase [Clostridium beijerinckii]MBO0519002.1 pyruvate carboxyltransferase [Clostridium beijerinckii]POO93267.1 pyruvate carboxyltransferase [Clostridium sp. 2-1]
MINGIKIFDCTIREVGYQTGWNFDDLFVRNLYKFAQGKGIDYIELGFFHNEEADPNRGIYRYCSTRNQEIAEVFKSIKNVTKISAMRDVQRPLANLLPKKHSVVDTIRLLTRSHETDFDVLDRQVSEIQELGYEIFLNFTSAGYNDIEKNISFAEFAKARGVKAIEFADTESVMTEKYVIDTIRECHKVGVELGVHLHDKNGTAEILADLAIKEGADYMDVTHLGLGGKWRDGNLTMEYLLRKLEVNGGYEATMIKNELIENLIKYNKFSVAE